MRFICPTSVQQETYWTRLLKKHRVEESQVHPICECLGALVMCMYLIKRGRNLKTKVKSTFSLGMTNVPKAAKFTIQVMARSLLVEMWSSMKKMHGIGILNTRRGKISFHFLMRRSKGKKFIKSPQQPPNHQPIQVHLLYLLQVHHLLQVKAQVKGNRE